MNKIDPSIVIDVDDEQEIERLALTKKKPCKLKRLEGGQCNVVHSGGVISSFKYTEWSPRFKLWVNIVVKALGREKCMEIEWPGFMTINNTNFFPENVDPEDEIHLIQDEFDFELNYELDFPGKEFLDAQTLESLISACEVVEG